jgi:hypothetical protein
MLSRRQAEILSLNLAHREHPLEFFSGEAKKQGHLFELFSPSIIRWCRAKPLDPRRKVYASHFLWCFVPFGATAVRLLKHTKLTQCHVLTSLAEFACQLQQRLAQPLFAINHQQVGDHLLLLGNAHHQILHEALKQRVMA